MKLSLLLRGARENVLRKKKNQTEDIFSLLDLFEWDSMGPFIEGL
jgi:hypothetical protein